MENEDWLDDSGDPVAIDNNAFIRLEKQRHTDGYRSGITAGKESTIQIGFDDGYKKSIEISSKLATYRGMLTAHLCHCMSVNKTNSGSVDDCVLGLDKKREIEEVIEKLANVEKLVFTLLQETRVNREFHSSSHDMQGIETGLEVSQDSGASSSEGNRLKNGCEITKVNTVLSTAKSLIEELRLN